MKTYSKSFLATILLTGTIAFCSLNVNALPVQDKMAPAQDKIAPAKDKMTPAQDKKKMAEKKKMDKKMNAKKSKMAMDTTSKM